MSSCIQIFTKAPIAGFCKTRLANDIGASEAIMFHQDMVLHSVNIATSVENCEVQLWCAPSSGYPFFQKLSEQFDLKLYNQWGNDLGEIMSNAACEFYREFTNIVQIGTDCPYMDDAYIDCAIDLLGDESEVVIGPANDGGYVLLAMNSYSFGYYNNIDWGTALVFKQLNDNLLNNSINYKLLKPLDDIDTVTEYKQWEKVKAKDE